MEYQTRIIRPEDAWTLAKLYQSLLERPINHNKRYLNWRLNNSRCPFPRFVSVSYHGAKPVGMRSALVWTWIGSNGKKYAIPQVGDLVIHPDHRNRGLFVPIMKTLEAELKAAGYSTIVGFSGGDATQRLQLGMGWKAIQPINILTLGAETLAIQRKAKPLRMHTYRLFNTLCRSLRIEPLNGAMRWARHLAIQKALSDSGLLKLISRDEYFKSVKLPEIYTDAEMWRIRDRDTYAWKLDNPTRQQVILNWSDSANEVFFILSWRVRHPFFVHISDLHFTNSDALLKAIEVLCSSIQIPLQLLEKSVTERQLQHLRILGFDDSFDPFSESTKYHFMIKHIGGQKEENDQMGPLFLRSRLHLLEMFSN